MKECYRMTLRFDLGNRSEKRAAEILQKEHSERGIPNKLIIAEALIAYYDGSGIQERMRKQIREIVREEIAAVNNGGFFIQSNSEQAQSESYEPDNNDLDDAFDCFGN